MTFLFLCNLAPSLRDATRMRLLYETLRECVRQIHILIQQRRILNWYNTEYSAVV
ncbi:hypothetical protein [Anabaena azotica]|uniref:Transposase n=1 Tax=Anabaena azotica FACHB-119 TaxID=947527 RepID=A0ABR8D228_9NOST|nr:hypothetical protein [Anabaena azotica]MBD2500982.1 hypothetical protein [Anabaena azotica FACHB-119]